MSEMKLISLLTLIIGTFIFSGCATTSSLNANAKVVKVSTKAPSEKCEEMGAISGNPGIQAKNFIGGYESQEGQMNLMRNKAAEMGANYVHTSMAGLSYCNRWAGLLTLKIAFGRYFANELA